MRVVLVVNPTKVTSADALRRLVALGCRERGWPEPVVLETSVADPGQDMTRRAVADGAGLVLSAGGDGTLMAVARALAHTAVPLGVLPLGTGNLLARNLDLPLGLEPALEVALDGRSRRLDLGMLRTTPDGQAEAFAVMAGIGFDAAMMADAPVGLKAVVGWAAYVVSGLRHLRDRPLVVELRVDGRAPLRRSARCVVVGNVGTLQAGLRLMPAAAPDDGLLDVVVLSPRRLRDWVRVVVRLAARHTGDDRDVERWQGRQVEVRTRGPHPLQLDGDPAGTTDLLVVEVDPGAVLVRVPR